MFKKGLVVIAVPFLVQIVFAVALWRARQENLRAQTWAIHTKEVIAKAESVSRHLTDAQNHVRGLVLTGDPALAGEVDASAGRVVATLKELHDLVADNPAQTSRLAALGGKIGVFLGQVRETRSLALAGRAGEAGARVEASVRDRTARGVRRDIDAFLKVEDALDRDRIEVQARSARRQAWAIAAGVASAVVIALVMVLAFSRGFARRIEVLGGNARRLAEGKPLAPPVGGSDEISQLDAVFHAMARSLAEKGQENEMFIYSVSHDLRSPLVNLQGFSRELSLTCEDLRAAVASGSVPDHVRARVETLLDRDINGSIHFIRTAVTRLSSIIDSLLRLSRAGRVVLRWQEVDVNETVGRVVEALRSSTSERGAEVAVHPLPSAWGDAAAVEQIFANLIGNAVHYLDPSRPGRVEVGAESDDGPSARGGDRVPSHTYYVKDNGLGIPKAYQEKLFLAFKRLHPDVASGEGIGLALVRRVVERHGGKIWVESAEGQGSTFRFTLPAAPAEGGSHPTALTIPATPPLLPSADPTVPAPAPSAR